MWILFFQTPQGRIKFITSDMDFTTSMDYWKFLSFVQENFKLKNFNELQNKIDSFETILGLEDGEWEVQEKKKFDPSNYTMTDLLELNENQLENSNKKEAPKPLLSQDDWIMELAQKAKNRQLGKVAKSFKFEYNKNKSKSRFGFFGRFF